MLDSALNLLAVINKDLQKSLEPFTFRGQKDEFPRLESSGLLWR